MLVEHHVAVTSTLPVFEHRVPDRPPLAGTGARGDEPAGARGVPASPAAGAPRPPRDGPLAGLFRREMALERAFVAAGGLLLAGPDPTGNGGTRPGLRRPARGRAARRGRLLAGRGDPDRHARTARIYLGRPTGSARSRPARTPTSCVVKGDPSTRSTTSRTSRLVFKDGVGYDPAKLIDSVRGRYGQY